MMPYGRKQIKMPEVEVQSDPSNNLSRHSGGMGGKVIIALAALVVLFATAEYVNENKRAKLQAERTARSLTAAPGQDIQFGGINANQVLENPEITWLDQIFCTGYRKSTMCSNKPLHPFYKHFIEDQLKDLSPEQLEKNYGLGPKEVRIPGKTVEPVHAQPQLLINN